MNLPNNRWPIAEWGAAVLLFLIGVLLDFGFKNQEGTFGFLVQPDFMLINLILGASFIGLIAIMALPFVSKNAQPTIKKLGGLFFLPFEFFPATIAGLLSGIIVYLQVSKIIGIFVTFAVFLFVKPFFSRQKEEFLGQIANSVETSQVSTGTNLETLELTAAPIGKPLYGYGNRFVCFLFFLMLVAVSFLSQLWFLLIFAGIALFAIKTMLFNAELLSFKVSSSGITLTTTKNREHYFAWEKNYGLKIARFKNEEWDLTMVQILEGEKSSAFFSAIFNKKYGEVVEKLNQIKFLTAGEQKIQNTSINMTYKHS